MYCRKCGNELYDTDLFCNRCGAPVNPAPVNPAPLNSMQQNAAEVNSYVGNQYAGNQYMVNPTQMAPGYVRGAEGLTQAGMDSERIIEEFYRTNRRREETQMILDMEYASIKGTPDPRFSFMQNQMPQQFAQQMPPQPMPQMPPFSAQLDPEFMQHHAAPVPSAPAPQPMPQMPPQPKSPEKQTLSRPTPEELGVTMFTAPTQVKKHTPGEYAAEEFEDEFAEENIEKGLEKLEEEPEVEIEIEAEELAEIEEELEELEKEFAEENIEEEVERLEEEPEVEIEIEVTTEENVEEIIEEQEYVPVYVPTEEDKAEWAELFPDYEPVLFFDPPEYLVYDKTQVDMTQTMPQPDETQSEKAPTAESEQEPASEQPAQRPITEQPVTTRPMQSQHTVTDELFAEAGTNAASIAAAAKNFDVHKANINQEAQATLNMLDELFADFDKPIADSVASMTTYTASAAYSETTGANDFIGYTSPNHTGYTAPTAGMGSTTLGSAQATQDIDKLAPATASGIATGKAIQKAVLDPEEEPPEEGFEDEEDLIDENGSIISTGTATTDAATQEKTSAEATDKKSGEAKKEKKGLFRRKTKEAEIEEVPEEDDEPSNIQKRSNVIVLNPEFLNPDEKASGKDTEDFRIASNMTHGVKAMDRAFPDDYDYDEEEYYEPRRGGSVLRKVLMGVLTALLLLAAVVSILITFGRDTAAGKAVLDFWDNIKGVESEGEEQTSEAELQEDAENTEIDNANNNAGNNSVENNNSGNGNSENNNSENTGGENTENANNAENTENNSVEEPADAPLRVVNENFNAAEGGFGEAVQNINLAMELGRVYPLDSFASSRIFVDNEWYQDENGESVTYNDAIFYTVSDYYSKLIERMNHDSEEVLEMIEPDTKLMTDVSGIKADAIVLHAITKMEVGEARANNDYYYVIVEINEVTNDGRPATTYKRVLRLVPEEETHTFKVAEIVVGD